MIQGLRTRSLPINWVTGLVVLAVLAGAAFFGLRTNVLWLALLVAGIAAVIVLQHPTLGLMGMVLLALVVPVSIGTGTEVDLNLVTLAVPATLAVWVLMMVRRRDVRLAPSRTTRPLALFLLAGLLSLLIGITTWDPLVPREDSFLLVQLAQWSIFAFSAGAFWLSGNLIRDQRGLRWLTVTFLMIAGGVAIMRMVPGAGGLLDRVTTIAFIRASLWVLLTGLAGGQLLFNRQLSTSWRIFLVAVLAGVVVYGFVDQQEAASNWVGIGATLGLLIWLRFPRLRWLLLALLVILAVAGILLPSLYNFAGGDAEWRGSGGSRLVLINRVLDVTMRNPITGLGPAAYRRYAALDPLPYGRAFWIEPRISSHNNYVDLFSHTGLIGLGLFLWFVVEVAWLGRRLHRRYRTDFACGYVNGVLAAGLGALVIMLLADWILPFVYNIGFGGFQASVLIWLFLGGMVALDTMPAQAGGAVSENAVRAPSQ